MDDALPVSVDLADPDLAADVTSHVESVLGWQVVQPGPHLPVRLRLADGPASTGPPTVVVRRDADVDSVRAALRGGALDVLAWPADAHRLPGVVPQATAVRPAGIVIAVAGTASGVGASTVALALGALHAWAGRTTAVLTDTAGRRLAGAHISGAIDPVDGHVAGVHGLRVVGALPTGAAPALDAVVVDRGVGRRATVLVGRPDAALVAALADAETAGAAVITVGEGGLRPGELARLVGDRAHVALPWSFRVARAGLRGRVPGALPGRLLAALGPIARLGDPPVGGRRSADQGWAA